MKVKYPSEFLKNNLKEKIEKKRKAFLEYLILSNFKTYVKVILTYKPFSKGNAVYAFSPL